MWVCTDSNLHWNVIYTTQNNNLILSDMRTGQ